MGSFHVGSEEHLECLQHLSAKGPDGASLCLAHKYTYHFVGLPAYVSDDGYVLALEGDDRFIDLDAKMIHDGQAAHDLPDPLPSYSLSTGQYVWGYSLWPLIALMIALGVWSARRKKRVVAADAAVPVSTDGPAIRTDGDRYIQAQVAPELRAGETITHQAYGTSREIRGGSGIRGGIAMFKAAAANKGVFAAWTGQRLFLIETRVGAIKPLLENKGLEVIDAARIRSVARAELRALLITLDDGTTRAIHVAPGAKYFSNQDAFARDLPRLAVPAPVPAPTTAA